jgi:hypothetical protein
MDEKSLMWRNAWMISHWESRSSYMTSRLILSNDPSKFLAVHMHISLSYTPQHTSLPSWSDCPNFLSRTKPWNKLYDECRNLRFRSTIYLDFTVIAFVIAWTLQNVVNILHVMIWLGYIYEDAKNVCNCSSKNSVRYIPRISTYKPITGQTMDCVTRWIYFYVSVTYVFTPVRWW